MVHIVYNDCTSWAVQQFQLLLCISMARKIMHKMTIKKS